MKVKCRLPIIFVTLLFVMIGALLLTTPIYGATNNQDDDPQAQAEAIFEEGFALYEQGDWEAAILKFETAVPLFHAAEFPLGEGFCQFFIGDSHLELNQYEKSITAFENSIRIWQEIGDREMEMTTLSYSALTYYNWQRYQTSQEQYQKALDISVELDDQLWECKTTINIGLTYYAQGDQQPALENYQQALIIAQDLGDQYQEARALHHIGTANIELGQYLEALDMLHQALTIREETDDKDSTGTTLNNIGSVYGTIGQPDKELEYYQRALEILQTSDNRSGEAITLSNIGMNFAEREQYDQALDYFQQAFDVQNEIADLKGMATTLNNIGCIYLELGNFERALEDISTALEGSQLIDDKVAVGVASMNIGYIYMHSDDYQLALEYLQEALRIFQETGFQEGEVATLGLLGLYYLTDGDKTKSISFYQQSIEVIESMHRSLKVEELKAAFISDTEKISKYQRIINLLWDENRFEEAFDYAERARARAFLDQLAGNPIDFRAGASTALLERERQLSNEIAARRDQLIALRNLPTDQWDTDNIAAVQEELISLEAEYSDVLTQIKIQNPEVASLISVDTATLDEIQTELDTDTTLVEYFLAGERTLAFVITHDSLEPVLLPATPEQISQAITDFRNLGLANLNNPHPKSLENLYKWLVEPLEQNLNTPKLGIIPHQELHYVPFSALTDGESYLSDYYVLFYLPSASILRFTQDIDMAALNNILALGNPTTTLPDLQFAENEVESITGLFGSQPLIGESASETAIWSQAENNNILHLAAHGEFNAENPLFSTIHLAADDQNDGRLDVHEIYRMNLSPANDLVVLSACQTQIGEISRGDEVIGLTRAFLYAGSPSVIASLWMVDDEATSIIMNKFYTNLLAGMGKAEALRKAQSDVILDLPHPYYWAAFVLTGDPGEISENKFLTKMSPTATIMETLPTEQIMEPTKTPADVEPTETPADIKPTETISDEVSKSTSPCGSIPMVLMGVLLASMTLRNCKSLPRIHRYK